MHLSTFSFLSQHFAWKAFCYPKSHPVHPLGLLQISSYLWSPFLQPSSCHCLPPIGFVHTFYLANIMHCAVLSHLVAQSCLTLCDPMDCSLLDSSVHGMLQARILEWVTLSSSRGSPQPRDQTQVSFIAGGVSLIAGWFFTIWVTREALIVLLGQ